MAINMSFLTRHSSQDLNTPYHLQGTARHCGESMAEQQDPKSKHLEVPGVFSDLGGSHSNSCSGYSHGKRMKIEQPNSSAFS